MLQCLSAGTPRRHPLPARHRRTIASDHLTQVAVTVAIAALVASGCGTGVHTNGLEKKSATQVAQAATAALKAAKSVYLTGRGRDESGKPVRLDLRIQGEASTGTIEIGPDIEFEMTRIGQAGYIKADVRSLQALGVSAAIPNLASRWIKIRPDELSLNDFSLDALAAQLTKPDSPLEPGVEQAILKGKKVVVISEQNGSKLYVANTGPAYPLRTESKGTDAGRLDLSEYGVDFHITAPRDAITEPTATPTTTAPAAPTPAPTTAGPMTGQELLWIQAVEQLLPKMNKAFDTAPTNITSSTLASLAEQLRGCTRELKRIGPPTARLQPVSVLVHQACREYDKGAQCFDDAARLIDTISGPGDPQEQAFNQELDCGFAASDKGGKPLADAFTKAEEIKANAH